jgi:hypothetical protein
MTPSVTTVYSVNDRTIHACGVVGGMRTGRGNPKYSEKTPSLFPPQISHNLIWDGMLTATVGSRLLTMGRFFIFSKSGWGGRFCRPLLLAHKFVRIPFVNFIVTNSARGVKKADPRVLYFYQNVTIMFPVYSYNLISRMVEIIFCMTTPLRRVMLFKLLLIVCS